MRRKGNIPFFPDRVVGACSELAGRIREAEAEIQFSSLWERFSWRATSASRLGYSIVRENDSRGGQRMVDDPREINFQ